MSIGRIIKNNYVLSLLSKMLLIVLGIVNSVLINRYLGPSLKGEYIFILNVVNLLVLFFNLGIYQSYPYYKRRQTNMIQNKYVNNVFFQFIIYFIIAIIISVFVNKISYSIILTLLPLMILTKQLSFILMIENINLRNIINIISALFYTVILVIVYFFTNINYMNIIISLYAKDIILISMFIFVYKLKPNPLKYDKEMLLKSIKFGIGPTIIILLLNLNYKVDILILKLFEDNYYIGIYSVGIMLAEQAWIFSDAFKEVLFAKTSKKDSVDEIVRVVKLNIYLNLIMLIIILLFGELIIRILYGLEFIEAYTITSIIFLGITGMVIYKLIYPYYMANGLRKLSIVFLSIVSATNILLNLLFIPLWGILGAAIASVFSYNLCGFMFLIDFNKRTGLKLKDFILITKDDIIFLKSVFNKPS
ncbi:MAG: hypothetical protein CVV00_05135 [Firmicutes bacterium HGW-Firmicutes-5]|nr:MAG: hypothetical protein CVV00_05135 [Firmicutes bacterium HGW-Firmicutes-5]